MILEIEIPGWDKYNPRTDARSFSWFRFQIRFFVDPGIYSLPATTKLTFIFLCCERGELGYIEGRAIFKVNAHAAMASIPCSEEEFHDAITALWDLKKILVHGGSQYHPPFPPYLLESAQNPQVTLPTNFASLKPIDSVQLTDKKTPRMGVSDREAIENIHYERTDETDEQFPTPGQQKVEVSPNQLMSIWNESCGILPRITKLTDARRKKCVLRLQEQPEIEYWKSVILKMAESPFCRGESDCKWIADFDWLIKNDGNHIKVSEGKYSDPNSAKIQKNTAKRQTVRDEKDAY